MSETRSKYYRLSIKALVLNKSRDKFLILKMKNGAWELPGGGLEWGEKPHEGLAREILEEMNVGIIKIADRPSYFLGGYQFSSAPEIWWANVIYETELDNLNFTPSEECVEVKYISENDLAGMDKVPPTVKELAKQFKPDNHQSH